ncbi:ATP synthase F1 subunit delta [Lactobacillus agrestimuris]|uniref:ATP synthase F1 subunit delta n=1 Tax=Lactobacillus agrestimuris TaxID=2941328 RepID=UPI0019B92022|nr:ATP synthase F1 subunit delta [Lactobacillus agrestimuris]MBD5431512.1 F0F1 ATP synthase subunit delta [Lactobacillus sp.]
MALSREELAARYGTALFGYAQDVKMLDSIHDELKELKQAIEENPKIVSVLSDPVLRMNEKEKILTSIESGLSEQVQNFLNLVLEYNRFSVICDVIDYFNTLYDQEKAIASGIATTAVKMDDDQLKRLGESLAKKYNLNTVRLENQVDPKIIGGVILNVKDIVIDGSVKNRLKKIRTQLIEEN